MCSCCCKAPTGALASAAALNPAMQRDSSKEPQESGEKDVAGASPKGHLQGTAPAGELVPSQNKEIQTQSWKVGLQQQSPKSRACPIQEWELRPLRLLQPDPGESSQLSCKCYCMFINKIRLEG